MERGRIAIIDDDAGILAVTEMTLRNRGFDDIHILQDSRNLLPFLAANPCSVIILDLMMPHVAGTDLLPQMKKSFPEIPVIVITAWEDVATAVRCMKEGASDLLMKPLNADLLTAAVEKALNLNALRRENSSLREYLLNDRLEHPDAFEGVSTRSKKMRAVLQYIEVIAESTQPVLITGETGVGKELAACAVAKLSSRAGKFVTVNVAGLDDSMFSDTLFGHRKGAFTGADAARDGLVSTAENGTLFLDEIGDLGPSSQVKLLRLIQEQEYYPVGSDTLRKTNARIVVATNRDLPPLISAGRFRKDLYYRLCAHRVHIPPLRERREDIPLLVDDFVGKAAASLRKKMPAVSADVPGMLATCRFEGNVRELQAMIYDAVARNVSGILGPADFVALAESQDPVVGKLADGGAADEVLYSIFGKFPTIHEVEDFLIDSALNLTKNNQRSAALLLGIARQTLSKRLISRNRQGLAV
jgi:two-component system, NtrC family, response regulator HydG